MRILVMDMSCQANGDVRGGWINCENKTEEAIISEMDMRGLIGFTRGADGSVKYNEFAITDADGFYGLLEEHTSLSRVVELVKIKEELGDDFKLFCRYAREVSNTGISLDHFTNAFQGMWDSLADWAEETWDACNPETQIPESILPYVDWTAYGQNSESAGVIFTVRYKDQIAVFDGYA